MRKTVQGGILRAWGPNMAHRIAGDQPVGQSDPAVSKAHPPSAAPGGESVRGQHHGYGGGGRGVRRHPEQ